MDKLIKEYKDKGQKDKDKLISKLFDSNKRIKRLFYN